MMPNKTRDRKHEDTIGITLWELVAHTALTTAAFLLIFGVAIGLDYLIQVIERHGFLKSTQVPLIWTLYGAKYIILLADFSILAAMVIKLAFHVIKRIIKS